MVGRLSALVLQVRYLMWFGVCHRKRGVPSTDHIHL